MGRKRRVFVWILITMILMGIEFIAYYYYVNRYMKNECPICKECKCDDVKETTSEETDNCSKDLRELDQALFTGIGMVFVSKDGDVYYEPKAYYDPGTSTINNLEEIAKKTFGEAQKYILDSENIFNMSLDDSTKHEITGYKLDLKSIKSVYYTGYGNSSANYVFAFVSYGGDVSIMKFENDTLSSPKKLGEYTKITSVVKYTSEAGSGLMFIDKCGNKYYYAP